MTSPNSSSSSSSPPPALPAVADANNNNTNNNHHTTQKIVSIPGKVVLVTGANRGIGKAFVEAFLDHGASKVYAGVRHLDRDTLPPEWFDEKSDNNSNNTRGIVIPIYMDLTQPESIQKAATETATDVDIVVNNAGRLSRTGPLDDNAIARLQEEMEVNVYGLMRMAQAFFPVLKAKSAATAKNAAAFVQINSVASFRCGIPQVSTYSASKAAAYSMTQALRQEQQQCNNSHNHGGIRILSVHPGPILTDMIANASAELAQMAEPPRQVADEVIAALTMTKMTTTTTTPPLENYEQEAVFHIFPDSKAKSLQAALQHYTRTVIDEGKSYGV